MSITYKWRVTGLKVKDENDNANAVVQVYWEKKGIDENGICASFNGVSPFTSTTIPEGSEFIPLEELTEEIVLEWVQAVAVGSYETYINSYIENQIDKIINPISRATLPWLEPEPEIPLPWPEPEPEIPPIDDIAMVECIANTEIVI